MPEKRSPSITVAMITMNEEKAVATVMDDIRAATAGSEIEILIVDSSRDRTAEIAAEKGARVIKQFPPQGYGRAMGRALTESAGEVVVTLDCDGTYPADRISEIAQIVLSGRTDLVNASRLESRPQSMPFANYLANWLFAVVAHILLGVKSTDLHSGMRAYRRAILQDITFDPSGPALPVDLLLKPALLGYRITEVFIPYNERIGVTSLRRWESTIWTFKRIFRLFPLRFSSSKAPRVGGEQRESQR